MALDIERAARNLQAGPKEALSRSLYRRAATIGVLLAILWIVWVIDALIFGYGLAQHGVVPRTARGLVGILWMPFLHGSLAHVSSNTLGFLFLGGILIFRSEPAFWVVFLMGAICSGLGAWLIGRGNSVHIGASGVIFAFFGYLLFAGIFERRIGTLLISLLVFFFWGGMLWSVLPSGSTPISWEGHLFGLAGGALAAKLLAPRKAAARAEVLP
jgi:membrane associated rhomboid family serine protease